jgi:molybdopterin molybdotransferase
VASETAQEPACLPWYAAREAAHQGGQSAQLTPLALALAHCDGTTLAEDLRPVTDLPPFPMSTVDGYAVRGRGPWLLITRILAGEKAADLGSDGVCAEIATGAMVPADTEAIIRVENSSIEQGTVRGTPRPKREWRLPGEEATLGEILRPRGAPVTPAIIGLAAASGHNTLTVRARPKTILLISGDELLTSGPSCNGKIRDSLGPQLPAWLRRLGADPVIQLPTAPVRDTVSAHLNAIHQSMDEDAEMIITTGGTMHGPADCLHIALHELNAAYIVNTVQVRPGSPMLLAALTRPNGRTTLLAGLPGNPHAAVAALLTLVAPAIAGLTGRHLPDLPSIELGETIPGRGTHTHLALVARDRGGRAHPLPHSASSALRGLAQAVGFALIRPHQSGRVGDSVPLVPLPVLPGE